MKNLSIKEQHITQQNDRVVPNLNSLPMHALPLDIAVGIPAPKIGWIFSWILRQLKMLFIMSST